MPYVIRKQSGSFCTYKQVDGKPVGKTHGCFDSRDGAVQQLRALYAAAGSEAKKDADDDLTPLAEPVVEFEDELIPDEALKSMDSPAQAEETDGGDCMKQALAEMKQRHADWTPEQCRAAAMKKCGGASDKPKKSFRERVTAIVNDVIGQKHAPLTTGLKVVGNHMLLVYSNNFEDREKELFPAQAIGQFVARVDAKLVPPPRVWVWHAGKAVDIGQADWVAQHGHFIVAMATFDSTPRAQAARKFYSVPAHQRDTSLSQGFTFNRLTFKDGQYRDFNTFEISLLPRGVEANRYTTLQGVKDMALTDEKKNYLKRVFGDAADDILKDLDEAGKALEELGVDYKDFAHVEEDKPAEGVKAAEPLDASWLVDLIGGTTEAVKAADAALKEVKTLRAEIKTLTERLDARPRSASEDEGTVLTAERLTNIVAAKDKQNIVVNDFWGIPVKEGN